MSYSLAALESSTLLDCLAVGGDCVHLLAAWIVLPEPPDENSKPFIGIA